MPFAGELDIRDIGDDEFVLLDELHYITIDGLYLIRVPAGFPTDLASIPQVFQAIFSVNGRHKKAAVVHDFLYSTQGQTPLADFTRAECDKIFSEAMWELEVPNWKRRMMYAGVRVGGWWAWRKAKQNAQ